MCLLLFLLVYKFIRGTFEYEKITRFDMVLIPAYSTLMMVITLNNEYSLSKILTAVFLLILGICIGLFQASKIKIQTTGQIDKYHRPIVKVKRGWSYLIGWLLVFIIIIIIDLHYEPTLKTDGIIHELLNEILKDISIVAFFNIKNEWFVWVLNVATSLTYDMYLIIHYRPIRQAIRKRH
ncbi:hydrophobic protein [Limosilactobacillus sp. STM2_1]|uniref:Hydrophobic protein n=1 Tax=Limosilactobacillus rudii TaxID=2759755 RepID=A0A7W3YP74_9LACO|nr:hydrophobic protein [Limosilactobacillus rudii]MBB1098460.1 hydrophobic protein [Limosilactobacillus rudii]